MRIVLEIIHNSYGHSFIHPLLKKIIYWTPTVFESLCWMPGMQRPMSCDVKPCTSAECIYIRQVHFCKNVAVRDSWTKRDVWEWVGKLVGEGFTEEILFELALEVWVVVYRKVKGKHEKTKHMQRSTVQIMNGCLFCSLKWNSSTVQAHLVKCGVARVSLRSSVINVKSEKGRFLNKGESHCLCGSVGNGPEWKRN